MHKYWRKIGNENKFSDRSMEVRPTNRPLTEGLMRVTLPMKTNKKYYNKMDGILKLVKKGVKKNNIIKGLKHNLVH